MVLLLVLLLLVLLLLLLLHNTHNNNNNNHDNNTNMNNDNNYNDNNSNENSNNHNNQAETRASRRRRRPRCGGSAPGAPSLIEYMYLYIYIYIYNYIYIYVIIYIYMCVSSERHQDPHVGRHVVLEELLQRVVTVPAAEDVHRVAVDNGRVAEATSGHGAPHSADVAPAALPQVQLAQVVESGGAYGISFGLYCTILHSIILCYTIFYYARL